VQVIDYRVHKFKGLTTLELAGPICEFTAFFEIRGRLKINKKSFLLRIFMVIFLVTFALVRGTLQRGGLHTLWCKVCNGNHRELVMNWAIG
jgi:hypothetical protein